MPVVSDYEILIGDSNVTIGDNSNESGFTKSFNTGGRSTAKPAFISFMVKGMTVTNENADVFVNDTKVGVLFNNNGGNTNQWQTQTVALSSSTLNSGNNVLRVMPVNNPTSASDDFDDYVIRNVICHFPQSA
ncbi:hypothetical protein [Lusitaniella coriacea]|uniref:hypothetical protein n=1 Tax=Lusitaniella coriacea TaxID=1983105 RepID=UPI003CEDD56D